MSDRVPFAAPQRPEDVLLTRQPLGVPLCLVVKHAELTPLSPPSKRSANPFLLLLFFSSSLSSSRCCCCNNRLFRSALSQEDAVVPFETYTRSVLAVLQGQECQLFPFDRTTQQFRFVRVAVPELCTRPLFPCPLASSHTHVHTRTHTHAHTQCPPAR